MKKQQGVSLVELVIFIAVLSVAVAGITLVLTTVLLQSPITGQISEALSLAQGRMEVVLGERQLTGYAGLSDPCASGSPPAVCASTLTGYTFNTTFTPTTINTDNHYTMVTVTVTGAGDTKVVLKSLVADY